MKGVILAAGYGTRFLPGTKTVPKEMFPLINVPVIHLIVDEMIEAGIADILIVTSRRKKALEDYFDREIELESTFAAEGADEKLARIKPIAANIFFLRQRQMAGTGDALLLCEPFIGDSPFVVAYPDDVLLSGPPLAAQLVELYKRTEMTVLAGQDLPDKDISRYGVVASHEKDGVEMVDAMVEKPPKGTEPSRLVAYGRYLYTPEIFTALRESRENFHEKEEFTQTEAINRLAAQGRVVVKRFEGRLLDIGTPMGYVRATIEYGLSQQDFRGELLEILRDVLRREGGS